MMSRFNSQGFTLIELLIVLVLIGLSTSFVLPNLWQQFDQAKLYSEKKQLVAVIEFAKEYSIYQGKPLEVEIGENTLDVFEATETSLSTDSLLNVEEAHAENEEPDTVKPRKNLKHIEFSTFLLEPAVFPINELNYFKNMTVVITIKGNGRAQSIEI